MIRGDSQHPQPVEAIKRKIEVTVTAVAAGNYSAGDVISEDADDTEGSAKAISIGRGRGDVVKVTQVVAKCSEDSVVNRLRLHFFDYSPAAADVEMDDNAVFAIVTATGLAGYLGSIDLPAFADRGVGAVAEADQLAKLLACLDRIATVSDSNDKVYMVVETLDAETNETAGMTIEFDFYVE